MHIFRGKAGQTIGDLWNNEQKPDASIAQNQKKTSDLYRINIEIKILQFECFSKRE